MPKVPRGERAVIAIIGRRNAGKSSLINALTNQQIAIVSDVAGTTTDPVVKQYELLPIGPVTLIDTAGLDDDADTLGQARVKAAQRVLWRADIAVITVGETGLDTQVKQMAKQILDMQIPAIVAFNKADIYTPTADELAWCKANNLPHLQVSCASGLNIRSFKEALANLVPPEMLNENQLVSDLVYPGQVIMLVVPIDLAAPKGRLILPQVQVLREVLDSDALGLIVKEREIEEGFSRLNTPPDLVITDSQVVLKVAGDVPEDVPLTTFSILFARYKGDLATFVNGARAIDNLKDGDKIVIAEACSHHVQADDIGRVKIPRWLRQYTGADVNFEVYAGHDFPENLEDYKLVIHCGGCMMNAAEMRRRIMECRRRGVPITNYGVAISKTQGVLERVVKMFGV